MADGDVAEVIIPLEEPHGEICTAFLCTHETAVALFRYLVPLVRFLDCCGENVEVACVDQGCTGEAPKQQAARQGVRLVVVKLEEAKRGFVLLPKRWVIERSFAWAACFRRLSRDFERLPSSLAGLHWLACVILMLNSFLLQSA